MCDKLSRSLVDTIINLSSTSTCCSVRLFTETDLQLTLPLSTPPDNPGPVISISDIIGSVPVSTGGFRGMLRVYV
jgi:hypothetical protein